MYQQAKAWQKTPSELLGLELGTWSAYCFDEAVLHLGLYIDDKLDAIEEDKPQMLVQKKQRLLERLLNPGKEVSSKSFADPGAKWGS